MRKITLEDATTTAKMFNRLLGDYNTIAGSKGPDSIGAVILFDTIAMVAQETYGLDMDNLGFRCECMDNSGRIHPLWFATWLEEHMEEMEVVI